MISIKKEQGERPSLQTLVNKFKFERILDSNPETKIISLLGEIDSEKAILTAEKTHFILEQTVRKQSIGQISLNVEDDQKDANPNLAKSRKMQSLLERDTGSPVYYSCTDKYSCITGIQDLKEITSSDIYHWGLAVINQDIDKNCTAKINIIWPASCVHIKKYDQQHLHIVKETPELYQRIVQPYIDEMSTLEKLSWVYAILYEDRESNRVIYKDYNEEKKDEGFIVLPDTRWDGADLESLFLVALFYRDDIKSLRDLKPIHKDWLINLNRKLRSVIPACYNYSIRADELRIFVHYQPSYYHFHIHIVSIKHPGLSGGLYVGKAVLLDEVIDNLEFLGPGGWMSRSITYAIGESHDLWRRGFKDEVEKQLKKDEISEIPDILNSFKSTS